MNQSVDEKEIIRVEGGCRDSFTFRIVSNWVMFDVHQEDTSAIDVLLFLLYLLSGKKCSTSQVLFTVSIHLFICSPSSLLTSSSGPFPGDRHLNAIYLRLLLTAIGLRKHSENGFSSAPEVLAFKLIVLIYEIIHIQHCMQYLVLQNY